MLVAPEGHQYPKQAIRVVPFDPNLAAFFERPTGQVDGDWPPTQLMYIGQYLDSLGCRTVLHERHYIDRDYIQDLALFYSRSLRNYPNHCQRLHFFSRAFNQDDWEVLIDRASTEGVATAVEDIQSHYQGFVVVRPLPGSPVGRTVLPTFGPTASDGCERRFDGIRRYEVHLGGLTLAVSGLAFQQQDQGVSACATTALWSALQRTSSVEKLSAPSPAEITDAASRYLLSDGRALPSEGLNLSQLCEAIRGAGLAPVVWRSQSPSENQGQLYTYLSSGLPPILAVKPLGGSDGHAVCGVGLRIGSVNPPTDPSLGYRDVASAVRGVYVHDDRLGPYASAHIYPHTTPDGEIATLLQIRWPDASGTPAEESLLIAMIVPVPVKLRLSAARLRALAHHVAEGVATLIPSVRGTLEVATRFETGVRYRQRAFEFGLTKDGMYGLACEQALSRYVGLIELSVGGQPMLDVVLDGTETRANPATLALVRRSGFPLVAMPEFEALASVLGVRPVS